MIDRVLSCMEPHLVAGMAQIEVATNRTLAFVPLPSKRAALTSLAHKAVVLAGQRQRALQGDRRDAPHVLRRVVREELVLDRRDVVHHFLHLGEQINRAAVREHRDMAAGIHRCDQS